MKVYQKITDLIGGTPLLELTNLEAEDGLPAKMRQAGIFQSGWQRQGQNRQGYDR